MTHKWAQANTVCNAGNEVIIMAAFNTDDGNTVINESKAAHQALIARRTTICIDEGSRRLHIDCVLQSLHSRLHELGRFDPHVITTEKNIKHFRDKNSYFGDNPMVYMLDCEVLEHATHTFRLYINS